MTDRDPSSVNVPRDAYERLREHVIRTYSKPPDRGLMLAARALVDAAERPDEGETDVSPEARAAFHVRNSHHGVYKDAEKGWTCSTCDWPHTAPGPVGEPLCRCGHGPEHHDGKTGCIECGCRGFVWDNSAWVAPVPVSDEGSDHADCEDRVPNGGSPSQTLESDVVRPMRPEDPTLGRCDHDCAVIVSDDDYRRSEGVCAGCGVRMRNDAKTGWGPLLPFGDVPCGSEVGGCCPPHKFTNEGAPDVCDTCGDSEHPPVSDEAEAWAEVRAERQRQDAKWGQQDCHDFEWASILMEEVGEAATEANEANFTSGKNRGDWSKLRTELVQVAAVAVAWVEAIDRRAARQAGKDDER